MTAPERIGQAALPLAVLPIATSLCWVVIMIAAALHLEAEWLVAFGALPLAAYYFLPNVGLIYLGLWGGAVFFRWRSTGPDPKAKLLATVYVLIAASAVAYASWSYMTGQRFSYL